MRRLIDIENGQTGSEAEKLPAVERFEQLAPQRHRASDYHRWKDEFSSNEYLADIRTATSQADRAFEAAREAARQDDGGEHEAKNTHEGHES